MNGIFIIFHGRQVINTFNHQMFPIFQYQNPKNISNYVCTASKISLSLFEAVFLTDYKRVIFNCLFLGDNILISPNKILKKLTKIIMTQNQSSQHRPFDYLKGKDVQFENAMKSIDNLYDDMFGDSSKYDQMFQTFKTQNNPITASIDQMTKQIFELDKSKQEKYVKVETKINQNSQQNHLQDDEESVVLGEAVYVTHYSQPYYQKDFRQ